MKRRLDINNSSNNSNWENEKGKGSLKNYHNKLNQKPEEKLNIFPSWLKDLKIKKLYSLWCEKYPSILPKNALRSQEINPDFMKSRTKKRINKINQNKSIYKRVPFWYRKPENLNYIYEPILPIQIGEYIKTKNKIYTSPEKKSLVGDNLKEELIIIKLSLKKKLLNDTQEDWIVFGNLIKIFLELKKYVPILFYYEKYYFDKDKKILNIEFYEKHPDPLLHLEFSENDFFNELNLYLMDPVDYLNNVIKNIIIGDNNNKKQAKELKKLGEKVGILIENKESIHKFREKYMTNKKINNILLNISVKNNVPNNNLKKILDKNHEIGVLNNQNNYYNNISGYRKMKIDVEFLRIYNLVSKDTIDLLKLYDFIEKKYKKEEMIDILRSDLDKLLNLLDEKIKTATHYLDQAKVSSGVAQAKLSQASSVLKAAEHNLKAATLAKQDSSNKTVADAKSTNTALKEAQNAIVAAMAEEDSMKAGEKKASANLEQAVKAKADADKLVIFDDQIKIIFKTLKDYSEEIFFEIYEKLHKSNKEYLDNLLRKK